MTQCLAISPLPPRVHFESEPRCLSRREIEQLPVIALVSTTSDMCWTGFPDAVSAIQFKKKMALLDDWRIRDRRQSALKTLRPIVDTELAQSMLIVGSMLADHLTSHISPVYGQEAIPSKVRREAVMFAASALREAAITCEKSIGRWRPLRGKLHHLGMNISHAWLEDDVGNILDVLPWNHTVHAVAWHDAGSTSARSYEGVSALPDGHGTEVGNILRGIISHSAASRTKEEFQRRNVLLNSHIQAYLARCRLPNR